MTHLPIIWATEIRFVRSSCWDELGDPLWAAVGGTLLPLSVIVLWAVDWVTRADNWVVGLVKRVQRACFGEWERGVVQVV